MCPQDLLFSKPHNSPIIQFFFPRFPSKLCRFFQNQQNSHSRNQRASLRGICHFSGRFFHPDVILALFFDTLSGHEGIPGREKRVQGIFLGQWGWHCGNPGSSRLRVPENEDAKLPGSSGGGKPRGCPPAPSVMPLFWDIPLDLGFLTEKRAWLSDRSRSRWPGLHVAITW